MKKLVVSPITQTIYWATVNEAKGMITGQKVDVTDNAIESVLDHMLMQSDFKQKHYFGYTYAKTNGGNATIMAFDETHNLVDVEKYNVLKEKAAKWDAIQWAIKEEIRFVWNGENRHVWLSDADLKCVEQRYKEREQDGR